ncbi:MAG: transposase [Planctomycetes bacterium]|nr:transposase [Planctomycetota bacterium]
MFVQEKKHRLPRECYRGIVTVSFTACIEDRRTPFLKASIVEEFLAILARCLHKTHCVAFIYCFMPDHLHLIVHGLNETTDTWQAMVDFKQSTGFWFAQHGREFKWQKDFHDHILRSKEELGTRIRYIADNPVRKRLVDSWQDYAFTGAIGADLNEVMKDTATL